ncbi:MAG: hypothetical protein QG588_71 [Candidatus Poribacteria bacterium]|nr:hypothetical protein [Candidatus Poribacteria bacterium]
MNVVKELDNYEVSRIIWDTFSDLASSASARDSSKGYFQLYGFSDNSVAKIAYDRCYDKGLIASPMKSDYPPLKHLVLKAFYFALNMGLLLPSNPSQNFNWNIQNVVFHFTAEGIKYFSEGYIRLDDSTHLSEILHQLQNRIPSISNGQIELLLEAQRCMNAHCYRAGMVLIGVANEDICLNLVESITTSCTPPIPISALYNDWNNCCDPKSVFSARWKPAIRLLEELKKKIRPYGKGESWWQWWEMIPGSLYALSEPLRLNRNKSAHDAERSFSRAELVLLLSGMPTQLEVIANLIGFLKSPPSPLQPPLQF